MKKILITGGSGYVGGRLCSFLSNHHEVWISSRKKVSNQELGTLGAKHCILHEDLLHTTTFPSDIDIVIHLAALNEHDCVAKPSEAIEVNINQTRIILENAISKMVKSFIYFSTVHVYGFPLKGFISEKSLPIPQHPYAITHKAAEDYVRAAGEQKKIKATVFRLANSFGAPVTPQVKRWTLLINDLCRQAIEKKNISIMSPSNQLRDFITLTDVCVKVQSLIESDIDDWFIIFNLSSNKALSLTDIAQLIQVEHASIFNEQIVVNFPLNFSREINEDLEISNQKMVDALGKLGNSFNDEIKNLLLFCNEHFAKA